MGLSSLSSSLARTQGAVGERSKSAIDEKLHRRLCRLPRSAQQQRCMVIALVCMCIVIAMAALQPIFGSLHSLLAAHPASLASRPPTRERHAQRGLSLPERLSAAYLDYMDETQAMQDQAEADETWIMPEECKQMTMEVDSRKTFYSELGQDLFLYKHFFRDGQTSDGRKRFFLDIGANSPQSNSNTFFFEKCLGWEGLCVEANPDLAKAFEGQRQCKVENVCISNKASTLKFLKSGYMGHVVDTDDNATNGVQGTDMVEIPCITITELLAKHNITHVDFLSIDIEAGEHAALSPLLQPDAHDIKIDVMAAEVFWSDAQLRWLLSDLGFWKVTDIAHVDDIFVRMKFMEHARVDARPHYYQMMKDTQRQRGRPIIAPW